MTVTTRAERELIRQLLDGLSDEELEMLARSMAPRVVEPYTAHIPHPTQVAFLNTLEREVLFGGAAGGGKSDAVLMAALQYVDVPGYSALILRRTFADLVLPGAIMDRAKSWLAGTPAHMHDGGKSYTFPSGAKLQFGYLAKDDDKYRYQSAEFQFIGFDELTQWPEEKTFTWMNSRIRRPSLACLNCNTAVSRETTAGRTNLWKHTTRDGRQKCGPKKIFPDPKVLAQYPDAPDGSSVFNVPLRMRAATNPGGRGAHWVKSRFIDPRTKDKKAIFVPSMLTDNPSLDQDSYRESLEYLDPVERERLLNGDWDITEGGDMFDRADFWPTEAAPLGGPDIKRVRWWDMAASESDGSDYTVGALCSLDNGIFVIEDIIRVQKRPHELEKLVAHTAQMDGLRVHVRMEQEPGSSGKALVDHYRRNVVRGFNFDGYRSTGPKQARASALASYVKKSKHVQMVIARWNREFLDEMEAFPNGANDDQVDGVSSGFNYLNFGRKQVRLL
jgi:predicted phage terminase large subunit-like protein